MPHGLRLTRCSAEFREHPPEDRPEPFQERPYLNLWLHASTEAQPAESPRAERGYLLSWSTRLFLFGRTMQSVGRVHEPPIGLELPPDPQEIRFAFRLSINRFVVTELAALSAKEAVGQLEAKVTIIEKGTSRPVEYVGYFEARFKRTSVDNISFDLGSVGGGTFPIRYDRGGLWHRLRSLAQLSPS